MKPIERSEILDYVTYGERRDEIRGSALRAKSLRRVVVPENFTFLFENRETVRYQILEMIRIEQIVKEADVQHEIDTYNELLHPPGTLGCSFLIGIDDPVARAEKLREWQGLNDHIYASMPDGRQVKPTWDPRQVGDERLSSVQYLTFAFGDEAPIAIGVEMPGLAPETTLTDAQREALTEDLRAE